MTFIDEAKIEPDEDGWHLILYLDDGQRLDYRIGNPEAFEYEVQRTIGEWLSEGSIRQASARARRYFASRLAEPE
jgi:hypothetical protein